MEAVSLTVGVVALAGLFSTCIDCFDIFETAHTLEGECKILLVKLDLEKTRLLIWGNTAGIMDDTNGRSSELGDIGIRKLVERCLESIRCLLTDSEKLQQKYGLQLTTGMEPKVGRYKNFLSTTSMNVFRTSYKRFQSRSSEEQGRPTLLSRTKWAIHDKVKFESLINHLKDLLDGLNQVLPVPQESQDRILRDDIASLDISKLRLVQTACEGSYQALSDAASAIIEMSECNTNQRHVEEWIENAGDTNNQQNTGISQTSAQPAYAEWRKFGIVHLYIQG